MKIRSSRSSPIVAAAAVCALAACASSPAPDSSQSAAGLTSHTMSDLNARGQRFTVGSHIWVDSWRSAFASPTFATTEEAIAALREEAAQRGADGLLDIVCLDQGQPPWSSSKTPSILCYSNAIRFQPGRS